MQNMQAKYTMEQIFDSFKEAVTYYFYDKSQHYSARVSLTALYNRGKSRKPNAEDILCRGAANRNGTQEL